MTIKQTTNFLLYTSPNGDIKVDVLLQNEMIRIPQKKIAELFDSSKQNISYHLQNIFDEGELNKNSTVKEFLTVQKEGDREVKRNVEFYNLDVIIAVGYRVNSKRATQFRVWSTNILKEYVIKGFVMDDERLKNPQNEFGKDYFDEQLERIRDIRSSERRFYQKITDIYAKCSIDYDSKSKITKLFFATVQNKLHFAITGQTAAEIIVSRADADKQSMGLKTWKYAPDGAIKKTDITIAKNYLEKNEFDMLNRIVMMYLEHAEFQARNKTTMTMKDRIDKLNGFLKYNEQDILNNAGKIEHEVAKTFAEQEFDKYKSVELKNYKSDFDKLVENCERIKKK